MKITYTSEDGKHWDNEADCLGWERFEALREAAEQEQFNQETEEVGPLTELVQGLTEDPGWSMPLHEVWKERQSLYLLAELMKQAEAG